MGSQQFNMGWVIGGWSGVGLYRMGLLGELNSWDQRVSRWIHRRDHLLSTLVLYPFAAFFHPALIWLAYLAVYLLARTDTRLTAVYALGTLLCLLTTTFLKKIAKRPRPELDEKVRKPHHFRKKEKNNAMPSGDAIQSALFSVFLLELGVDPLWVILFHIAVCLGRVYYMCHWVADTLVATVLGSLIGVLLLAAHQSGNFKFIPDDLL